MVEVVVFVVAGGLAIAFAVLGNVAAAVYSASIAFVALALATIFFGAPTSYGPSPRPVARCRVRSVSSLEHPVKRLTCELARDPPARDRPQRLAISQNRGPAFDSLLDGIDTTA
jgi:hypothetical protein